VIAPGSPPNAQSESRTPPDARKTFRAKDVERAVRVTQSRRPLRTLTGVAGPCVECEEGIHPEKSPIEGGGGGHVAPCQCPGLSSTRDRLAVEVGERVSTPAGKYPHRIRARCSRSRGVSTGWRGVERIASRDRSFTTIGAAKAAHCNGYVQCGLSKCGARDAY